VTAYRQGPTILSCPRCGEILERVSEGVETCRRCEGVWLATPTIDKTFGTPYWPQGASAWWRRALACPVCAYGGGTGDMSPVTVENILVDRCPTHGLWLDHGELGRLMGTPEVVELEALHELMKPDSPIPPKLVALREARQAEQARRERERAEYAAKVDEEARRAKLAKIEEERARLMTLRNEAMAAAAGSERELITLREQVHASEAKLADARGRILEIQRKLDALV
jgi:Zn-finger nucleic acid-binding protein